MNGSRKDFFLNILNFSGLHIALRSRDALLSEFRGINAHSVSPPARASYSLHGCTNLHCLVNRDTIALVAGPQIFVRKSVVSVLQPGSRLRGKPLTTRPFCPLREADGEKNEEHEEKGTLSAVCEIEKKIVREELGLRGWRQRTRAKMVW